MKKTILMLAVTLSVITASAQKFGITAGMNVTDRVRTPSFYTHSIEHPLGNTIEVAEYLSSDWLPGFRAGVFMDFAITPHLSLIPELLFSQKRTQLEMTTYPYNDGTNTTFYGAWSCTKATLYYIELPVNIAYKFNFGGKQSLFPFAGAYVAKAVSGNKSLGSGKLETKRIDYGLNYGLGYQHSHTIFKVQYNQGLANLSNISGNTDKNTNVAITVGYVF